MASTYKTLGQVTPAATTLTTLYTVPAATSTVTSTLSICNTTAAFITVRVAVRIAGAAITTAQYVMYDTTINPRDTFFLTLGMSLAATDVVSVYASATGVAFNLFGSEIA